VELDLNTPRLEDMVRTHQRGADFIVRLPCKKNVKAFLGDAFLPLETSDRLIGEDGTTGYKRMFRKKPGQFLGSPARLTVKIKFVTTIIILGLKFEISRYV
jgi:hypothetical protein